MSSNTGSVSDQNAYLSGYMRSPLSSPGQ